ncbi:hypothetical protein Bca4012_074576 [Brassica carinata]|uniref:Uncharacterized protein n=1 Tax=Brassica carinata TaxID=52824 RepID=A0A8X7UDT1_BRACI|nr:hypothetical protein Bca52824_066856 [Brassica carinata]
MTIVLSNLRLKEQLQEAFGEEDIGACMILHGLFSPELSLGLSPHLFSSANGPFDGRPSCRKIKSLAFKSVLVTRGLPSKISPTLLLSI